MPNVNNQTKSDFFYLENTAFCLLLVSPAVLLYSSVHLASSYCYYCYRNGRITFKHSLKLVKDNHIEKAPEKQT